MGENFIVDVIVDCDKCERGFTDDDNVCDICTGFGSVIKRECGSAWTTLERIPVHENKHFSVWADTIIRPTGDVGTYYLMDKHPSVFIVPIEQTATNNIFIYMIKQFRYATKSWSWELPAGAIDKGELALKAAKRELWEETGFKAYSWEEKGKLLVAPGLSSNVAFIYEAKNLIQTGSDRKDEEGIVDMEKFSLDQIKHKIRNNEINDGPTISVLAKLFWA